MAGQGGAGLLEESLYLDMGLGQGLGDKGRVGRKRWKVSKPISSSIFILKALLSEHFTPNRLVGYICIRQTSCCNWSKYLPGTVSFYILMVEGCLVKRFSLTNPLGKAAPKHLVHCCFNASRQNCCHFVFLLSQFSVGRSLTITHSWCLVFAFGSNQFHSL